MRKKQVCPYCGSDNIENRPYNPDDHGLYWYDHWVCLHCGKTGFKPSERKINMFRDIVPPKVLCEQIPDGDFIDSVFVWKNDEVHPRKDCVDKKEGILPAPTIKEILEELARMETCPRLDMLVVATTGKVIYTLTYGVHQEQGDNPEVMILNVLLKLKEKL